MLDVYKKGRPLHQTKKVLGDKGGGVPVASDLNHGHYQRHTSYQRLLGRIVWLSINNANQLLVKLTDVVLKHNCGKIIVLECQ